MSSERTPKLTSNMYIKGIPAKGYPYNDPPHVSMRSLAGGAMNLTPDEARTLAAALVEEADHADGKVAVKEPLVPGLNLQVVTDLVMTLAPILRDKPVSWDALQDYDRGHAAGKNWAAMEIEKVLAKHGIVSMEPSRGQ